MTKITRSERANGTHEYQYCHFGPRKIEGYGPGAAITVCCRFDDNCKNGHDTFSITADVRVPKVKDIVAGGCLHEEIVKVFPELKPLIKWHLCSTDGPMHYVANTLYHASDRDHWGLRKGEESKNPRQMKHYVRFGNSPIEHEVNRRLKAFIDELVANEGEYILDRVDHPKEPQTFGPKFQLAGMDCKWYECPFDTEGECRQWIDALTSCEVHWTSRTGLFGEGKERQLDFARNSAIWPEATDEQLCSPDLSEVLEARLPQLLVEFRAAMEGMGFTWLPANR